VVHLLEIISEFSRPVFTEFSGLIDTWAVVFSKVEDCNADGLVNESDYPYNSDRNLLSISRVTPAIGRLDCVILGQIGNDTQENPIISEIVIRTQQCIHAYFVDSCIYEN